MRGYKIAEFPQDRYKFRIYDNPGKKSWQTIKAETGAYALINLGYFSFATFEPDDALMVAGKWLREPAWGYHGILIDAGGRLTVGPTTQAVYDYCNGEPVYKLDDVDYPDAARFARSGNTMLGVKADGTVVLLLCPKDEGQTSGEGVRALEERGCVHILRFDGSWSSQGSLGPGLDVDPSQERRVRSYLLVFKKEADKPVSGRHIVCLDPGHGPDTVNGSPDGTYKEKEFAWDMGQRVKALLEEQGVGVILTRAADTKPSLTERAQVSNAAGADCLVSLHSNAGGGSGWSSARGLMVYTSAGPTNAPRNILARDIIDRMQEAGVLVRSTPVAYNIDLTVLVKTDAPACLIEYGFHTNQEDVALLKDSDYRDKLAKATAHGICDWLGVSWTEPETPNEPSADKPAEWAAYAWEKAYNSGILDGTRPTDNITRQELAVVLDRLWLLD